MPEDATPTASLENRTFDELQVGDRASLTRTVGVEEVALFSPVCGDINPAQLDPDRARIDPFHRVIAHGMCGGLISSVLGTELPGPGTIYLSQWLEFRRPVHIGDTVTATVTVMEKEAERHEVALNCSCVNQRGETVIIGRAVVQAPKDKVKMTRPPRPDVRPARHDRLRILIEEARIGPPLPTAVVHPCDPVVMAGVAEAAREGLIAPILVGPPAKVQAAAAAAGVEIDGFRLEPAPHSHAAADRGVALVRAGEAQMLMKGSLHTDELMSAVIAAETGLRTQRRISHVYVMDAPAYPRLLLITDAAINIAPDLEQKRDIVQNAVELAQVIGIATPKVAILSAVETVNAKMCSTLDAAALCKMADRGQITGALLEGPLALDNAVSPEAAREKGIVSAVAGQADILLAPDLEAGNILAKQLTFLGGAEAAGVVLGARVPIVLTSRADSERTRIASCAVAALLSRAHPPSAPGGPPPSA